MMERGEPIMYLFDKDTAVVRKEDCHFTGQVSNRWSVNGNPDGGYLMAMLGRAILDVSEKVRIAILTANFISRCRPGDADLKLERMGLSTNFDRWQGSIYQNGRERVRAMCTLVDPGDGQSEVRYEAPAPILSPPGDCIEFPAMPTYTLFDNVDVRLESETAGWMEGRLVDKSEFRGWVRFRETRPMDQLAILLMVDAFPPPIFASQGMVAWVPTLELSVNIRSIPATKWLKCIFRSRYINDGMVEEDAEIWDENDALVAIARQVSQYRKQA